MIPLRKGNEGTPVGVTNRRRCVSQCRGFKASSATQDTTGWQDKEARVEKPQELVPEHI